MKAVITAGGPIDGEYARLAGTAYKALARVGGRTLLASGIEALREIGIEHIAVVGGDEVSAACAGVVEKVIPDTGLGSTNVLAALDAWSEDGDALLYLTCDMPFVTGAALRTFIDQTPDDTLTMPLSEYDEYIARFPDASYTGITLDGTRVVNGGVFHIPPGSADRIRGFAARLFDARKSPWRMATIAGPSLMARFLFNRLSIERLEARGRQLIDIPVMAVRNCAPELAFDCDTVEDYRYALERR